MQFLLIKYHLNVINHFNINIYVFIYQLFIKIRELLCLLLNFLKNKLTNVFFDIKIFY